MRESSGTPRRGCGPMPWWRALLGRRAVGTLAALTAAVLMAGCTSNPEPAPLPSPSASGSESAGASPS
ncbi:MAG TPA: hypothetical protein VFM50_13735, partial [Nocardioidaceae bacterium]|nr:hypothetical protein [Nocardioidaceae bacterium]